jgi:hypothetical protein
MSTNVYSRKLSIGNFRNLPHNCEGCCPSGLERREVIGMAYRISDPRVMPDDDLIQEHDRVAHNYPETPSEIRQELERRVVRRQGRWMIFLTAVITVLTVVNAYLVYVAT